MPQRNVVENKVRPAIIKQVENKVRAGLTS